MARSQSFAGLAAEKHQGELALWALFGWLCGILLAVGSHASWRVFGGNGRVYFRFIDWWFTSMPLQFVVY